MKETEELPMADQSPCGATPFEAMIGTPIDQVTLPEERVVRVIRPGQAVTMDHSPSRLNIELDDKDAISRVFCG